MKTLNIKYLIHTQADPLWDDFELPLVISDQNGQIYLITAGEVADEDDETVEFETSYFVANLFSGKQGTEGYGSVSEIVRIYKADGIELVPVKMDMIVTEYLKASL